MLTRTLFQSWLNTAATESDFEALYQTELPRVYNFFRYRVGDGALAEDLTSETFEKAWRGRDRYRKDLAAFSTWLFAIARRVAVDYYRRQRVDVSLDDVAEWPTHELTEDVAQQQADFERLSVLLARFEDRDRELVALKYGAGLTNRTIAGLTGLSESNVGTILHRAVQKLRTEWEITP